MIVAGFGFRDSADLSSLRAALAATGATPERLATAAGKSDHPAMRALADALALPLVAVPEAELAVQRTLTHSVASRAAHGTGSVAEAAALAAAGTAAILHAPRSISPDRRATCAIATGETP